jgi:predicted permease
MSWWRRIWHKASLDEQLAKELRFHIEEHTADLIRAGHDPEQARRLARLELGGNEQIKEAVHDTRGTRWLEDLYRDARYALRALRQEPGFAAAALLTLAVGIGGTTLMFTVVNGVLLTPLPYPEPEKLLTLQEQTEQASPYGNLWAFAYPNFLDVQRESRTLATAAWRVRFGTVSGPGAAEYAQGREVSSSFFSVLGVTAHSGRVFLDDEDRAGASPVAVIGYGLWQRQFGGDPSALGQPIVFDGRSYTVVGITPPDFEWAGQTDVILPLGQSVSPAMQNRQAHPGIRVVARLRPGATMDEARTELGVIGRRLANAFPASNTGRGFLADPLRPEVGDARSTLWLLLGAVTVVLLIACVNVASLLLARAVSRERELAIRTALGAARSRLVRQCLTESAALGLAGGGLGVMLAVAGTRPFVAFWPSGLPRADQIALEWRVLAFAVAVSVVSGLLFGLAPALRVPFRAVERVLRAGTRSVAGSAHRLHKGFVMAEIALALVLLVSAGMLGHMMLRLSALDPGVNVDNVLVTRMALSPETLNNPDRARAAWNDVLDRARSVPGVDAIALLDTVPMRSGNNQLAFWPAPSLPPRDQLPLALATSVTPDYLKVMGVPLIRGRFIDERDRKGSEIAVVVDEVMAKQAFGSEDPIGKQLWMPDSGMSPLRVVGVVRHVRHWGLAGDDAARVRAQFYYAFAQVPDNLVRRWSELMSIAVRTNVEPTTVVAALQRELRGASGDQVLYQVRTMDQLLDSSISQQRFLLLLFAVFAGLALLLASIGVYGVLSYVTRQRAGEMGLRIALGASSRGVIGLVLGQSLKLILAGIALGLAGAVGAGRLLERFVVGMQGVEPWTFVVMATVLMLAALLASALPARRAGWADPISTLRGD